MKNLLWYKEPAATWEDALPLGNGHIGAMVFGRTVDERIALNDDTLWAGYPKEKTNPDALEYLPKVQQLIMEGDIQKAQEMANLHLAGLYTESYLPLGDLKIRTALIGEASGFIRNLDIQKGIAAVSFNVGDVHYERESFVSTPADAFVMRLSATEPANYELTLESKLRYKVCIEDQILYMHGYAPEEALPSYHECDDETAIVYNDGPDNKAMKFATALQIVETDGTVAVDEGILKVNGARTLIIKLNTATSFNGFGEMPDADEKQKLAEKMVISKGYNYAKLLSDHCEDFQKIFDRVEVDFGHNPDIEDKETPERMQKLAEGIPDPDLIALLFQYGRYLMISGSRPGTTPTNLQGIWNEHVRAPWSSNYTININTEMNYWMAETCNLSEMAEPFIEWMQKMAVNGQKTAKESYGARGWVSHHNSDIWAHTASVGPEVRDRDVTGFSIWPMSSGWLCSTLWEHYQFTGDEKYLREKALPVMMSAARFYLDFMIEDADGKLVTVPSISPENTYIKDGQPCHLDVAPTMDTCIIRELFGNCLKGAEVLNLEDPMLEEIKEALPKLPEFKTGQYGQLLEWSQDYEEYEVDHRHVSHMYGLFPADLITVEKTPELAGACEKSLNRRGFDGTGWSLAWKVALWARLGNGENAHKLICQQLRPVTNKGYDYAHGGGCYSSLLGAHPPFQIDGNYGIAAGIAEMLVQSHGDEIKYLPAIPESWKDGYVRGLKVRGGQNVDIAWADGKITEKKVY